MAERAFESVSLTLHIHRRWRLTMDSLGAELQSAGFRSARINYMFKGLHPWMLVLAKLPGAGATTIEARRAGADHRMIGACCVLE